MVACFQGGELCAHPRDLKLTKRPSLPVRCSCMITIPHSQLTVIGLISLISDRCHCHVGLSGYPYFCSTEVAKVIAEFTIDPIFLRFENGIVSCPERLFHSIRSSTVRSAGPRWSEIEGEVQHVTFSQPLAWLGDPPFLNFDLSALTGGSPFRNGLVCLKSEAETILADYLRHAIVSTPLS